MLISKKLHRWLRALFLKSRFERELDAELRFHFESLTEANIQAGMDPAAARRAAQLTFGGVDVTKEDCRDTRVLCFLESLWRDLCFGTRMIGRSPAFAATAVLTLTLGIASNTAVFSIMDAVLFRPLPFAEPDRLVRIARGWSLFDPLARTHSLDLLPKVPTDVFERVSTYDNCTANLNDNRSPARVVVVRVTAGFFPMLGIPPWRGRSLSLTDFESGRRVLVLGYDLWRKHFNADPNILQTAVRLNGSSFTIVGIMPREFHFHFWHGEAEAYCPLLPEDHLLDSDGDLPILARLKSGISPGQAEAQVAAIFQRQAKPGGNVTSLAAAKNRFLIPLTEDWEVDLKEPLWILSGAVAFVFLIACVNVANLLLARGASRQREIAIRAALGCTRGRFVRQQVAESLLLSLPAGALGLLLTNWMLAAVVSIIPVYVPRIYNIGIDWHVLSFALAASILSGLAFGTAPSWHTSTPNLNEMLKQGGLGGNVVPSPRLRNLLVVAEIALALVLLSGSGLLLRSLSRYLGIGLGFKSENILTLEMSPLALKSADLSRQSAYYQGILERIRALPGVQGAAITDELPVTMQSRLLRIKVVTDSSVEVAGVSPRVDKDGFEASYGRVAGPDYFRILQILLLAGRYFNDHDGPQSACVVILDKAKASKLFPDKDAVGRHLILARPAPTVCEIVGVVDSIKYWNISRHPNPPLVYLPASQANLKTAHLLVSTAVKPAGMIPSISSAIGSMDKDLPIYNLETLDEHVSRTYSERTFTTLVLTVFAGLALLLAMIGSYSVMAYSVTQRTREIGIRMATGAQLGDVLRLFVKDGMKTVAAGAIIGLGASLALTRLLSTQLFETSATDPFTLAVTLLLLSLAGLLACYVPARRAAKLDVMNVLRQE